MSRKRSARETELEIETLRLKQRIEDLEQVIKQQSEGLKESTKLLQRCRPTPRVAIPHDKKLLIASEQHWKCADPFRDCPQWSLSDGTFSAAGGLFEADHIEPWSASFRTVGNIHCLCAACHCQKTRRERLLLLEQEDATRDVVKDGVVGESS